MGILLYFVLFWNQQGGAKYKVAANIYIYIDIYILRVSIYI